MFVFNKLSRYIIYIDKSVKPGVEYIQNVYPRYINGNLSGLDIKHFTGCYYGLLVYSQSDQCIIYNRYVKYRYHAYNDSASNFYAKYLYINIFDKRNANYKYEFDRYLNLVKWTIEHVNIITLMEYTTGKYTGKYTDNSNIKTAIEKRLDGKRGNNDYDQHIKYKYINRKIKSVKNTIMNYGINAASNISLNVKYKNKKINYIKLKMLNDALEVIKVEKYIPNK